MILMIARLAKNTQLPAKRDANPQFHDFFIFYFFYSGNMISGVGFINLVMQAVTLRQPQITKKIR